jgi:hypothetical protein
LRKWTLDGTWEKILAEAVVKDDAIGEVEWILGVDSTVVRAHRHAAGARKRGPPARGRGHRSGRKRDWALRGRTEQQDPSGAWTGGACRCP